VQNASGQITPYVGRRDEWKLGGPSRIDLHVPLNSITLHEVRRPSAVQWTTPSFSEVKMDAEIGSYQEDGDDSPLVKPLGQLAQRGEDKRDAE
jgi:hypothetical protein